ncbi:MAG: copper resistance protein NlpE N-terminal domain-containing protein [Bacteroidaceae bacterium]|nr:copper resistance protein NlpE N-terminal domain-containing protein [Bacteroidaceae bacterium]MBQ8888516.1 copper resistance protein NlpE N-terminal domain-containing protein [Bacteroidaceae bacterium]
MKKLMMLAAIVAALASCQSNKKNAELVIENDSVIAIVPAPAVEVDEEIFTGTLPAADGPGIDYVLTLGVATDGVDTLYTLDMTYLDANGPGKHETFSTKGKQKTIHKTVKNKPKKAVKLTPDNGEQPTYFLVVNDTTLRLVNDSTLVETIGQAVYDITKVKNK